MEQYSFCLDVTPGGVPPVVHAVQYDNLARTLCITLTDGGTDFSPLTAVTAAYLYGRRPDGTQIALAAAYDAGTVTAALTASFTAQAGAMLCLVCLTGADDAVLGSAPFILDVRENPCETGHITASDDFRDAVSGWVQDHSAELTKLYGEAVSAVTALTAGYQPENLLPWPYFHSSGIVRSGVTYTVLTDGGVHCEGTAEANNSFYLSGSTQSSALSLPPGTYTLSGGQSSSLFLSAENITHSSSYSAGSKPVTFTAAEEDRWFVRIRVRDTAGDVNTDIYPMLARGGSAQAYSSAELSRVNLLSRIEKLEGNT